MESSDYTSAVEFFTKARDQIQPHASRALLMISLVSLLIGLIESAPDFSQISGWKFDDLDITIRRCHCEALYAACRIKEAGESLLNTLNIVDEHVYMAPLVTTWISGALCCLGFCLI